ncbi:vitamin B12 dependent methionine synthase [Dehalobacterium formicoaceticum]|uniref:Vitamin B12 dependent methionine synthase n=1 Tax=Dehalobacterium formicoaceticum TaxID=51515 RepID=A0ABT1Y5M4_9FIRM|nr:vitamin B12 dependent methionine synthase [Dehalobacterium formicoaceticum]MCR6546185.1 vitamin B12 dependent methionine synthase [Dehalobacterium formicoaceticum]
MDTKVYQIPCAIDREDLLARLHIKPDSSYIGKVDQLIDEALKIGNPKIAYKLAFVDDKGDDFVVIEGIRFSSRILRVNMEDTFKAVPFVVTCGTELADWAQGYPDTFDNYIADGVMEAVLRSALEKSYARIDEEFNLGHAANMNPGSLPEWPLTEQEPLFQLLGDVQGLIGVELKSSFLMSPIKTESGIRFPKEGTFYNCQLCSREDNCPGRKAPFDKDLYKEKYLKKD